MPITVIVTVIAIINSISEKPACLLFLCDIAAPHYERFGPIVRQLRVLTSVTEPKIEVTLLDHEALALCGVTLIVMVFSVALESTTTESTIVVFTL